MHINYYLPQSYCGRNVRIIYQSYLLSQLPPLFAEGGKIMITISSLSLLSKPKRDNTIGSPIYYARVSDTKNLWFLLKKRR